jgi:hypothetical protein
MTKTCCGAAICVVRIRVVPCVSNAYKGGAEVSCLERRIAFVRIPIFACELVWHFLQILSLASACHAMTVWSLSVLSQIAPWGGETVPACVLTFKAL